MRNRRTFQRFQTSAKSANLIAWPDPVQDYSCPSVTERSRDGTVAANETFLGAAFFDPRIASVSNLFYGQAKQNAFPKRRVQSVQSLRLRIRRSFRAAEDS